MHSLPEHVLDFETKAIDTSDVKGQSVRSVVINTIFPLGMNKAYEAHRPSDRAPPQVSHTRSELDAALAVDIGGSLFHRLDVAQQRFDLDPSWRASSQNPLNPPSEATDE
jgi:hypothetical protein